MRQRNSPIHARRRRAFSRAACIAFALASFAACRQKEAPVPAPSWPAGTVLVMNGFPVGASEVDEAGSCMALIEPEDSLLQLRRIALAKLVFPHIAARGIAPEQREELQRLAADWRAAIENNSLPEGPLSGPMQVEKTGNYKQLGFEVWKKGLELEIGHWSPVIESAGSFHIIRVKDRSGDHAPGHSKLTIDTFDFPYLDPSTAREQIERALDRSTLKIVDPAWNEAVPTAWQYRMRGGSS